jgi:hypothetical protein
MAITLVQSQVATGTSLTSLTVTLGTAVTPGNTLIVCIAVYGTSPTQVTSSITIGGSTDHFAAVVSCWPSMPTQIWADPNVGTSSTSVVITFTGGSGTVGNVAYVYEVSGLAAFSIVDQTSACRDLPAGSDATWTSGPTPVTAQAAEFWVGIGATYQGGGGAISGPASPWTNLAAETFAASPAGQAISGYQITTTTGQATYSGATSTYIDLYGACTATFVSAPVAPTPHLVQLLVTDVDATNTGVWTTPVNVTAGNLVIAAVGAYAYTGTAPSISAVTFGTNLVPMNTAVSFAATGTGPTAGIYYLPGAPSGQAQINVTCTGSTAADNVIAAAIYEFSITGLTPQDTAVSATATSATWSSGATATTAYAPELAIGLYVAEGGTTTTYAQTGAGTWSSSTAYGNVSSTLYMYLVSGFRIITSTGTVTYSGTSSASELYEALAATFGTVPAQTAAMVPRWRGISM